jgi:hypothetical protein
VITVKIAKKNLPDMTAAIGTNKESSAAAEESPTFKGGVEGEIGFTEEFVIAALSIC